MLDRFLAPQYSSLAERPNGEFWWHSMPLPDGRRISGAHDDKDVQFDLWAAMEIAPGTLAGRRVLDIGANDGFFSLAALASGAASVTSIDSHWNTWPRNLRYAASAWNAAPQILTGDFRTHEFGATYDVVFFLGVLYHVEDVFGCMKRLHSLLVEGGTLYVETQMTAIESRLPIFEHASDVFATVAPQDRANLGAVGISNYLFPNPRAMFNLAYSYGFSCEKSGDPQGPYAVKQPLRHVYRMRKLAAGEQWSIPAELVGP